MKTNILPFQLGMEYENWEFDLEPINDRIKGYDSYSYIKDNSIPGVKLKNVELIFYWEILVAIILEFEESDVPVVEKLSMIGDYTQVKQYFYLSDTKINSLIYDSLLC